MRTRKEIEELNQYIVEGAINNHSSSPIPQSALIIELLLDIRDLLEKPPVEISGSPLPPNHPIT